MKKIMIAVITFIGIKGNAALVYQGVNPVEVPSYNVTTQSAIALSFKNTGSSVESLVPTISGTNFSDFKISLNRCNNIAVNKMCQIAITAISKTIPLGQKSISVGGANLNITVVKLDSNGNPIVVPPAVENLDITPNSLADLQFIPGEKYKTVSLSVKNVGSVAVTPVLDWDNNSANVSFLLNRCNASLKPNKSCSISLKVPSPANGVSITQSFQSKSSSQIRDSLSFVIKGPVGGGNLSCTFNGSSVLHGASITAYQSNSVAFGSSCVSQSRSCNNGVLSGTYTNPSCSVQAAATCSYNSITYNHGDSIPGFSSSSVPFGSLCSSVAVSGTCNNGVIDSQPSSPTCSVQAAATCSYNSITYNHGDSIPGFSAASVAYGQLCSSVAVSGSCNNGVVDNQPSFATCSVDPLVCNSNQHLSGDGSQCLDNFQVGYKLVNDYSSSSTVSADECKSKIDLGGASSLSGLDFYLRYSSDYWDNGYSIDSGFCSEYMVSFPSMGAGLTFKMEKGNYIDCGNGNFSVLVNKGSFSGDYNQFCQDLDAFSPMKYTSSIENYANTVVRNAANPYNIRTVGDQIFYIISNQSGQTFPGFLAKTSFSQDDLPSSTVIEQNYVLAKFEAINNKIIFRGYSMNDQFNYKFYSYDVASSQVSELVLDQLCSSADALNLHDGKIELSISCNPRKFFVSSDGSNFFQVGSSNQPFFHLSKYEFFNNSYFFPKDYSLYSLIGGNVTENIYGFQEHFLFKQGNNLYRLINTYGVHPQHTFGLMKYNQVSESWDQIHLFLNESGASTKAQLFQGNNFSYIVLSYYDSSAGGAGGSDVFKTYLFNPLNDSMQLVDTYNYARNCSEGDDYPFFYGFVNKTNDNLITQKCNSNLVQPFSISTNGVVTTLSSQITPFLMEKYNSQYPDIAESIKKKKGNIVYKNKDYFRVRSLSEDKKIRLARIDSMNNIELIPDICSSSLTSGLTNNVSSISYIFDNFSFDIYKDNLIFPGNSCQGEVTQPYELELFKYFEQ